MTTEEVRAFMLAMPARTAALATARTDGTPHVAPVWFDLDDDGAVVFTTAASTVKGRNLVRSGRCSLMVDDERPPFSFVTIEGTATTTTDLDAMRVWATRIGGRYMGADNADALGRRNAVEGELLVRVTPTKVVSATGVAD